MTYRKPTFTVQDVIDKFGETPRCYLTGEILDIYQPRTYHFDHKHPVSRGGSNALDNLGVCTADANIAKGILTEGQFIDLCRRVLEHNGFHVKQPRQASNLQPSD